MKVNNNTDLDTIPGNTYNFTLIFQCDYIKSKYFSHHLTFNIITE